MEIVHFSDSMYTEDMDTHLLHVLREAGLNPKQASVYLALLVQGEATAQEISKVSGIKRPTVYAEAEELKAKGLVRETKTRGRTYFVAEPPKEILRQLKGRADRFERNMNLLERAHAAKNSSHPHVTLFNGAEGFRRIWHILFASGVTEYCILTDAREMLGFVQKKYITKTIIREKIARKIKSRQIITSSDYAKEILAKDAREGRVSRVLPHFRKIPFTKIIFGDTVALISPLREDVIILVESEAFAKTEQTLFEALWETLPASPRG